MHLVAAVLAIATLSAGGTPVSVYDFKVKTIDGKEASLAEYKGKALLIVNTASQCGYTPQYAGLEALYVKYRDRGFTVLGFPSNDFGGQEPGTNTEIKKFCELRYKTTFPLFSKIPVKGDDANPLYKYLTSLPGKQGGAITWNFNKFLIGPDGTVIEHFDSRVDPMSSELTGKLEQVLPTKG
jgi:glutathione peroxidase